MKAGVGSAAAEVTPGDDVASVGRGSSGGRQVAAGVRRSERIRADMEVLSTECTPAL